MSNIILNTDSYKASHYLQFDPDVVATNYYIEARNEERTLFFGLQAYLIDYLSKQITEEDVQEADEVFHKHGLPFNREGWQRIIKKHNGYIPVQIDAVPEGDVYPSGTPLVQVKSTDPNLAWVPGYIETGLLRAVWYPSSVATYSFQVKQIIKQYMEKTCDDLAGLSFKLHDFGARGVSSNESAAIGGGAHLVNFLGTDTVAALDWVKRNYDEDMAGFSIPAAEHSTITSWGKDREDKAFKHVLYTFLPDYPLVAVVSDSYNLKRALVVWGKVLADDVAATGHTVVIRPDSGHPATTVISCLKEMENYVGMKRNKAGYLVLPKYYRLIQGDGVNKASIGHILHAMLREGYSAENIAFGMGGSLLQGHARDDQGFAMKLSAVKHANSEWLPRNKEAPGKVSKAGIQPMPTARTVYINGELFNETSFAEVRDRAASHI